MDKSKIINLILVIISVIVLAICICIMVNTKGSEGSEVVLVKDMVSNELRVIGDKTDVYNNSDETLYIKGYIPERYEEPEDIFKEEEPAPIIRNNKGTKESIFVGNPNKGELKLKEEEIIEVQIIEPEKEEEKINRISLEDALRKLREIRNEGKDFVQDGFPLFHNNKSFFMRDLPSDLGLIIVPFNLNNQNQVNNLKNWAEIYNNYKDSINIIFMNNSLEKSDSTEEIYRIFEEIGLSGSLVYYDEFGTISSFIQDNSNIGNLGYCILNRDNYVYQRGYVSNSVPNMDNIIVDLNEVSKEFTEQEELIITKYNEGYIITYADVSKVLNGEIGNEPLDNNTEEVVEENNDD